MEMSVREARAQFATALSAAERGERVTITKNGKPIAEIGPPTLKKGGTRLGSSCGNPCGNGAGQV